MLIKQVFLVLHELNFIHKFVPNKVNPTRACGMKLNVHTFGSLNVELFTLATDPKARLLKYF